MAVAETAGLVTITTNAPSIRDQRENCRQSLRVLKGIKEMNRSIYSKSSITLGLGETESDVAKTMRDLREASVDILTLPQAVERPHPSQ
jgi:lipoic acid synthetase